MIATLENRVSIQQFITIDDNTYIFHNILNSDDIRYIMLSIKWLIIILKFIGRLIEVGQETLSDERIKPRYIRDQAIKVIIWTILKFRKKIVLYL